MRIALFSEYFFTQYYSLYLTKLLTMAYKLSFYNFRFLYDFAIYAQQKKVYELKINFKIENSFNDLKFYHIHVFVDYTNFRMVVIVFYIK